ncbi:ParA family protein [Peribacillus frigoritolerans]|uniref:ParA family protein n=1 Tax=Peribacillus frigoritolerans TaxID=450367 RepID=UPI0020403B00|nr:ParA family protein [Peribacillus frigoritolerans]MCM3169452.1 ParA family protein [Peribacillus frigoritolerans]
MATKITFGNFKGGVGKTTTSSICAFLLQEQQYKVLVIDFDPSTDCTKTLCKTFEHDLKKYVSVYEAMKEFDLSKARISLSPYLDILPSGRDLADFGELLIEATKGKPNPKSLRNFFLQKLLSQIENDYDFIIIDVPPTESDLSNNAMFASDFIVPIMQTEVNSYEQTQDYIAHIQNLRKEYKDSSFGSANFSALGIVCYLESKRSKVDQKIVKKANKDLGNYLFKTHVYKSDRIKRYADGITRYDFHDKRTLKVYEELIKEILVKVGN